MIEHILKECVFHFNKGHLKDPAIPMWVIKFKGQTMYINHMSANIPWSTKETPGNESTKGSIKFKNCLLKIDDNNDAILSPVTEEDKERLKKAEEGPYARIIIDNDFAKIKKYIDDNNIGHGPYKKITGGCSTLFYICDIQDKESMVLLSMMFSNSYRILLPNEEYYKWYTDAITEVQKGDVTASLFDKIKSIFVKPKDESEFGDDEEGGISDISEWDTIVEDDDDE